MIEVTLLGTAATLPRPERALSSAALTCDGRTILFDCGEGTQLALHRHRVNPQRIDLICLSHYHGDHIFGLPGLLQTMSTLGRTEPLYITGPAGLKDAMAPILSLARGISEVEELPYPLHLLPMPEGGLSLHDLQRKWPMRARLTAFPTEHRIVSQGYRFDLGRCGRFDGAKAEAMGIPQRHWRTLQSGQSILLNGRTIAPEEICGAPRPGLAVVFTGDTAPCEAVVHAAQGADLLLMDATYADETQARKAAQYGHSTFAQTARAAAQAGVHQLWLTHFSASIADPESEAERTRSIFPGAICGQDGLRRQLFFGAK